MDALQTLRVSVARIAQALGVDNDELHVTGANYALLCELAETRPAGWNDLAGRCVEGIQDRKNLTHREAQAQAAQRAEAAVSKLDFGSIELRIAASIAAGAEALAEGSPTGRAPGVPEVQELPPRGLFLTPEKREELICALAGWTMEQPEILLPSLIYGRIGFMDYTDAALLGAAEARGIVL